MQEPPSRCRKYGWDLEHIAQDLTNKLGLSETDVFCTWRSHIQGPEILFDLIAVLLDRTDALADENEDLVRGM